MNRYRKLLSAVIVPALVFGLEAAGVELPPNWADGVILVVTPLLVWAIPNEA
ncbi:hypothetical protein IID24_03995 [Patescibacteria group bacterium]|nr:hypothetical protein [Patescibacteria group bacterium]